MPLEVKQSNHPFHDGQKKIKTPKKKIKNPSPTIASPLALKYKIEKNYLM